MFRKKFFGTRLSLTTVYMILLALFLALSGAITRSLFSEKLNVRFAHVERRGFGPAFLVVEPTADSVQSDLSQTLLIVDAILIVLAGVASYALASLTIAPIEEAYESQRQFLSDASHELRTPLAILQADLENERAGASEAALRRIESHLEEVQRMSALVADVLLLSKTEKAQEIFPDRSPISLRAVLAKAHDRLATIAAQHDVSLMLNDVHDDVVVIAREDALLRCFTNVVENAILYNHSGGTVTLSVREGSSIVSVVVEDTGAGIAEQDIARIFDRFYRGERSRSRQTGGTGLGLAIVKSLVESFGGTVALQSIVGRGTTVTISLPIHRAS